MLLDGAARIAAARLEGCLAAKKCKAKCGHWRVILLYRIAHPASWLLAIRSGSIECAGVLLTSIQDARVEHSTRNTFERSYLR